MGKSIKPEKITAREPFLQSGAANMRCTISWSVPCVAMVMNVEPKTAVHNVYSLLRMLFTSCHSPCPDTPISKKAQGFKFSMAQGL